jgi:hypothetical protein
VATSLNDVSKDFQQGFRARNKGFDEVWDNGVELAAQPKNASREPLAVVPS